MGEPFLVRTGSMRDAYDLAMLHKPPGAVRIEVPMERWPESQAFMGMRVITDTPDDVYHVTLLDEHDQIVESYSMRAIGQLAVKAHVSNEIFQKYGKAIEFSRWVDSRRIIVKMMLPRPMKNPVDARQHARNVAVSRPGGSRTSNVISRLNNPVAYLVELRDLSGTRMGGIRVSAQTIAEARKIAKASMAKRGLKIKYEWSEFTDQSGETIIPATVLPTIARNPAYASNCYRWW